MLEIFEKKKNRITDNFYREKLTKKVKPFFKIEIREWVVITCLFGPSNHQLKD